MEHRTLAVLVAIVIAFGAWHAFKPKPTGIDDPAWDCPTSTKLSSWECVRK